MNLDTKIDIILKNMNNGKWYPLYDFIEHWLGNENSSIGEDQILIDKMIEDGLIKKGDDGNKFMITPTGRSINDKGGWLTTLHKQVVAGFNQLIYQQEKEKKEKNEKRFWKGTTAIMALALVFISARQCQHGEEAVDVEKINSKLTNQIDSLNAILQKYQQESVSNKQEIIALKNTVDSLTIKLRPKGKQP